jgi:hypothetical protein
MTGEIKRAVIPLGSVEIEGFMMPDGSYRAKQAAVAEAIGQDEADIQRFFQSEEMVAELARGHHPECIEITNPDQPMPPRRITVLPLPAVTAYWLWQSHQGNEKALELMADLMTESLGARSP